MAIRFKGQLSGFIPGNFISWQLRNVPKDLGKQVSIPDNSEIIGAEAAVKEAGVIITGEGSLAFSPKMTGAEKLRTAVFEIEKTGRKSFEVIKYIGELKTTTTHTLEV